MRFRITHPKIIIIPVEITTITANDSIVTAIIILMITIIITTTVKKREIILIIPIIILIIKVNLRIIIILTHTPQVLIIPL